MPIAETKSTPSPLRHGGSALPIAAAYMLALLLPALADGGGTQLPLRSTKPDYSSSPADLRQWFRDQKSPKTKGFCCDEADGGQAQEKIENGKYWASWCIVGDSKAGTCERSSGWIEVPDDVVIHGPNLAGHPVVWSYYQGGKPQVRCFAPGPGI